MPQSACCTSSPTGWGTRWHDVRRRHAAMMFDFVEWA
jgi:hypothetical protein